jgi:nitrile hydratase
MAQDHDPRDHSHGHASELSEMQLRVRALESILLEKGYIDAAALDEVIETYERKIGPRNGASIVAKARVDPARQARPAACPDSCSTALLK